MDVYLRIKELREQKGMTGKEFSEVLGVDNSQYSKIEKGKLMPTLFHIMEISSIFNISTDWLLTGKGSMIRDEKKTVADMQKAEQPVETRPRIPYNAAAGSMSFGVDGIALGGCEQLPVIQNLPKYDFTIIAYGDSMLPDFYSGDELACRLVKESTFIQWGRSHVLDTAQGVLLKNIFDNGESILCESVNTKYRPFPIAKNEIYNLAIVVGLVRRY